MLLLFCFPFITSIALSWYHMLLCFCYVFFCVESMLKMLVFTDYVCSHFLRVHYLLSIQFICAWHFCSCVKNFGILRLKLGRGHPNCFFNCRNWGRRKCVNKGACRVVSKLFSKREMFPFYYITYRWNNRNRALFNHSQPWYTVFLTCTTTLQQFSLQFLVRTNGLFNF